MSSSFLTGDSTSSLFFPLHNMEREKIFQIPPKFLILNLEISNMDSISHQPIHLSQIVLNGVHSCCTDRDGMSLWSQRWSMWRTCTEMRSADQIADGNQDQMTIELFALNVLSNKSLKLNVDQKVLGRELLLHLAEHLCTSYLAGDKVFAQIHIRSRFFLADT